MATSPGQRSALEAIGPLAQDTRKYAAMQAVRNAVLSGQLKPGERIKEVALANSLGISRPTVREALQLLVFEGILTLEPYRGVRIVQPTREELIDATTTRIALETLAAQQLASRRSASAEEQLAEALERHCQALDSGDEALSDQTHLQLHRTIWIASGNAMLVKLWPQIVAQIQIAMMVDEQTRNDPESDRAMHQRLVRVITTASPDEIAREVREHIERGIELLRQTSAEERSTSEADD